MALSPGDRKALGKRAADLIDAKDLILISREEYEAFRAAAVVDMDRRAHFREVSSLISQVIEAKKEAGDLRDEAARSARAYLGSPCPCCGLARDKHRWLVSTK